MLRAQERHKEMETLLYVHSFCEQVCVLSQLIILSVVLFFNNWEVSLFPPVGICPGQGMQAFFRDGRAEVLLSFDTEHPANV